MHLDIYLFTGVKKAKYPQDLDHGVGVVDNRREISLFLYTFILF